MALPRTDAPRPRAARRSAPEAASRNPVSGTYLNGRPMNATTLDLVFIRHQQNWTGAYPASPSFSQYPHCWLRDSSFIAHAMNLHGRHASARAFHEWVGRTLAPLAEHGRSITDRHARGTAVDPLEMLPARFTVDGDWIQDDGWPNFQLDGYGLWLWSFAEHLRLSGEVELPAHLRSSVEMIIAYLNEFWLEPCSDAWEEHPNDVHTATLACLYAGLVAISSYASVPDGLPEAIKARVLGEHVRDGRLMKSANDPSLDASLLMVATPCNLLAPNDPIMLETTRGIRQELSRDGGLIRYRDDSYYGAGAWLLLTDLLAWHLAREGDIPAAGRAHAWVSEQRDARGFLPEQTPVGTTDPEGIKRWTRRWGPSANPLLWSHAMHLIAGRVLSAR